MSQKMPVASSSWKRQKQMDSLLEALKKEYSPANTLILAQSRLLSDFRPTEW